MKLENIRNGLKTEFVGKKIYFFRETASTNDLAKELASKGAEEGTVVISENQRSGRGRLSRRWLSPNGGLWFSIILKPDIRPEDSFKLTFLSAVAVVKALRKTFKLHAQIKWPNDVLIHGKKVCGILSELNTDYQGFLDFVIIGIGINANIDLNLFPKHLRRSVTSIMEEMKAKIDCEEFLQTLLLTLETCYKLLIEERFCLILREWRKFNCVLGEYVEVASLDRTVKGQAIDVDRDGALLIKHVDGTMSRVISGDVTLKRFYKPHIKIPHHYDA